MKISTDATPFNYVKLWSPLILPVPHALLLRVPGGPSIHVSAHEPPGCHYVRTPDDHQNGSAQACHVVAGPMLPSSELLRRAFCGTSLRPPQIRRIHIATLHRALHLDIAQSSVNAAHRWTAVGMRTCRLRVPRARCWRPPSGWSSGSNPLVGVVSASAAPGGRKLWICSHVGPRPPPASAAVAARADCCAGASQVQEEVEDAPRKKGVFWSMLGADKSGPEVAPLPAPAPAPRPRALPHPHSLPKQACEPCLHPHFRHSMVPRPNRALSMHHAAGTMPMQTLIDSRSVASADLAFVCGASAA